MLTKTLTNKTVVKTTTIINSSSNEINLLDGPGDHTLTGGLDSDLFFVSGTDTITNLGLGKDTLFVATNAIARATLAGDFTATSASMNNGSAQIMTNGFNINLKTLKQGSHGFTIVNNGSIADTIVASNTSDTIICGLVNDTLSSGFGSDSFVFNIQNYRSNTSNYPLITDFSGSDRIKLQIPRTSSFANNSLSSHQTGQLKPNDKVFYTSPEGVAINAENRLIYNNKTGILSFDIDGNGPISPQIMAQLGLTQHFNLNTSNIIILPTNKVTGSVSITGKAIYGQTLTASNDFVDQNGIGSLVSYQWLVNGKEIPSATGLTFTPSSPDLLDKKISVRSTYTDLLGQSKHYTSKKTPSIVLATDPPAHDKIVKTALQDSTVNISFTDINTQAKAIIDAKTLAIDPQAKSIYLKDPFLKFDIEGVASGTLNIGSNANSATPWNPLTNHIIDATHQAFWRPDSLSNNPNIYEKGLLNAFKIIGLNNSFHIAIQEQVTVTPVNHAPVFVVETNVAQPQALTTPITINEAIIVTKANLNTVDFDNFSTITYGLQGGVLSKDSFSYSHTNSYGTLTVQRGTGKYTYTPNIAAIASSSTDISKIVNETVSVSDGIAPVVNHKLTISTQVKFISGNQGNNTLKAIDGNNILFGNAGNDSLMGGKGSDIFIGGLGTDTLTGGTKSDIFKFNATSESKVGVGRDVISNFTHSKVDLIDLSKIDADTNTSGNQAFRFIGSVDFFGKTGQLHYVHGILSGDVNGDSKSDFEVAVTLVGTTTLVSTDFIL